MDEHREGSQEYVVKGIREQLKLLEQTRAVSTDIREHAIGCIRDLIGAPGEPDEPATDPEAAGPQPHSGVIGAALQEVELIRTNLRLIEQELQRL